MPRNEVTAMSSSGCSHSPPCFIFCSSLLTLPSDTRARHKVTTSGREEAAQIHVIHEHLLESITIRMGHMAELCELLKREGLPPNEVSSISVTVAASFNGSSQHCQFVVSRI